MVRNGRDKDNLKMKNTVCESKYIWMGLTVQILQQERLRFEGLPTKFFKKGGKKGKKA